MRDLSLPKGYIPLDRVAEFTDDVQVAPSFFELPGIEGEKTGVNLYKLHNTVMHWGGIGALSIEAVNIGKTRQDVRLSKSEAIADVRAKQERDKQAEEAKKFNAHPLGWRGTQVGIDASELGFQSTSLGVNVALREALKHDIIANEVRGSFVYGALATGFWFSSGFSDFVGVDPGVNPQSVALFGGLSLAEVGAVSAWRKGPFTRQKINEPAKWSVLMFTRADRAAIALAGLATGGQILAEI